MAKAATLFYGPALLTGSAATLFTTTASHTALIRHIHLNNEDTVARTVTLSIGADAAGTEILTALSVPANSYVDIFGYWPVGGSVAIQGFASLTNKVNITIAGDDLSVG